MTVLLSANLAAPAHAVETAQEALFVVQRYIETHNSHDIEAVMEFYAADAVFNLSMNRGPVTGRDAIRGLEEFDVAAQSTLYPQNVVAERDGDLWRVHIGSVIEHSEIFEATGLRIVMAQGIRDAFVLKDGLIQELNQPDLEPVCTETILEAFRATAAWMITTDHPERADLLANDFLNLTPATIPRIIEAIKTWKAASGWKPEPSKVSQCATFSLTSDPPSKSDP